MSLSYPVQRFIEDNIILIEEDDLTLFFYNALFALTNQHSEELSDIITKVLNIKPEQAIKDALVYWCEDNIVLKHRKNISVSRLLQNVPRFGYTFVEFRSMFVEALKEAYPNKTTRVDNYGIEFVVEKS